MRKEEIWDTLIFSLFLKAVGLILSNAFLIESKVCDVTMVCFVSTSISPPSIGSSFSKKMSNFLKLGGFVSSSFGIVSYISSVGGGMSASHW